VQLRQDTLAGDHFSLVGFQTQLKWGEQERVLRMIPGLEQAEFVRFGMVHRNTYINGPRVLRPTWQTKVRGDLLFAGQVSGVEGYVESAASGLLAGLNAARLAHGAEPLVAPRTTAIGALAHYVSHADSRTYQPTNITFGIIPPIEAPSGRRAPRDPRGTNREPPTLRGVDRKRAISERALADLQKWEESAELGRVRRSAPREDGEPAPAYADGD
jgi:methylenetetrahydrofolate--tRNA-(uracil-5-)-methyltransferase